MCLCVYRPPSSSIDVFLEELDLLIDNLYGTYDQYKFIIAGDFNINLLDNGLLPSKLLDVMLCHMLHPTIFLPTRPSSGTLLDNIFISWPASYSSFVINSDLSDHLPVLLKFSDGVVDIERKATRLVRNFSIVNKAKFLPISQK